MITTNTLPLSIVSRLPYRERVTGPSSTTDAAAPVDYSQPPVIIRTGGRDSYFWGLACSLAKRGMKADRALITAREHYQRCEQPPKDKYDFSEVEKKLERAFEQYGNLPTDTGTPSTETPKGVTVPQTLFLTLSQALERFLLIADGSMVADLSRHQRTALLSLNDFKNKYANTASGQTKLTTAWLNNPKRKTVHVSTYYPSTERMVVKDGTEYYNRYIPTSIVRHTKGVFDVPEIFKTHISYLYMGDKIAVSLFYKWLAFTVQKPHIRIPWAPVLISQTQGVGKGWLFKVLELLLGKENCFMVTPEMLDPSRTFNAWWGGVLLWIDELTPKYDFYERLKHLITETSGTINPKYGKQEHRDIFCNVIATSNHINALKLDKEDRRFWVTYMTSPVKPPDYYKRLFDWLEGPGPEILYNSLLRMDLSGFDHAAPPPHTQAKQRMLESSRMDVETLIMDAVIERDDLFAHDMVPDTLVRKWCEKHLERELSFAEKLAISKTLNSIEPRTLGQVSYTLTLPSGKKETVRPTVLSGYDDWCRKSKKEISEYLLTVYEGFLK